MQHTFTSIGKPYSNPPPVFLAHWNYRLHGRLGRLQAVLIISEYNFGEYMDHGVLSIHLSSASQECR